MVFNQLDILEFMKFKESLSPSDVVCIDFYSVDPDGYKMPLSLSVEAFNIANPKTVENVLKAINNTYRKQVGLNNG